MCMYNIDVCYMFLPILIHSVYCLMRCDKVLLLPIGKIIKIFYMLIINFTFIFPQISLSLRVHNSLHYFLRPFPLSLPPLPPSLTWGLIFCGSSESGIWTRSSVTSFLSFPGGCGLLLYPARPSFPRFSDMSRISESWSFLSLLPPPCTCCWSPFWRLFLEPVSEWRIFFEFWDEGLSSRDDWWAWLKWVGSEKWRGCSRLGRYWLPWVTGVFATLSGSYAKGLDSCRWVWAWSNEEWWAGSKGWVRLSLGRTESRVSDRTGRDWDSGSDSESESESESEEQESDSLDAFSTLVGGARKERENFAGERLADSSAADNDNGWCEVGGDDFIGVRVFRVEGFNSLRI